jgi:hypothetical protein
VKGDEDVVVVVGQKGPIKKVRVSINLPHTAKPSAVVATAINFSFSSICLFDPMLPNISLKWIVDPAGFSA